MTEWAEKYRKLSTKRSSMPGAFRAWKFQREPMDVLSPHDLTQFVILMCAAQVLKTTAYENTVGCFAQNDPCPILVIEPREDDVQYLSKSGIDPMVRETPSLRRLFAEKKSRDSSNTISEKHFVGGSLTILGAQVPENFQMRSVRVALGDEVDRWPRLFPGEGSPVSLFIARTANFRSIRKVALASTPTIDNASVIQEWFKKSDQRRFFVPCPLCRHMQVLVWSADYAPWPTRGSVVWGEQPEGYIEPADAHYRCEACEKLIPNWRKSWMINNGEWRAGNPRSRIAGFHLSRLYSPITPWGDLAEMFLGALDGEHGKLQSFVNTQLAEVWRVAGDAPEWEIIAGRADDYFPGQVPEGVIFLTAGVDVQQDRIEVSIYGWGRRKQRWLIEHEVIWGSTAQEDGPAWSGLDEVIGRTWTHEGGAEMTLLRVAIDSGHATQVVYSWARKKRPGLVIVVKGFDSGPALVGQPKTTETVNKRRKRGVLVYPLNVSMAKAELYGQLRLPKPEPGAPYPIGWFHHFRAEDGFYKQITAERYIQQKNKLGVLVGQWHTVGRNEALDCANYARGAAEHAGISKFTEVIWRRLERQLGVRANIREAQAAADTQLPAPPTPPPPPAPLPALDAPKRSKRRVFGTLEF